MTEVLEVSSDSNDATVAPMEESNHVISLVKKYTSENCHEDEDDLKSPFRKKQKTHIIPQPSCSKYGADTLQKLSEKYKKLSQEDEAKELLTKQRQQKKKEAEQEKLLKRAASMANKNLKPAECMKFICVQIDNEIMNEEFAAVMINSLTNVDVKYTVQSQIFPHTISWIRNVQTPVLDDDGELVMAENEQDTDHVVVVMNAKQLVEHVQAKTLSIHIASLKSVLNKAISLLVFGLGTHLRDLKKCKSNQVTKKCVEYALTELQLVCSCSHRLIETEADLGQAIVQYTKSIAQIPFKQQRSEKYLQTDWFAAGDNRDSVKVDKSGNGLSRLWNQMLTTFPLARLETAEAISSQYPAASSLMDAYEACSSVKDAELLLQDIPVRRAAGPLSTSRRIGPELSKKIYNFFTSLEGDALLGN